MDVCVNVMCVRDIAIVINLGIDTTFFFFLLILFTAPIWLSMANVHMRLRQDKEKGKGKRMAWFPVVVVYIDRNRVALRSVVPLGYG